MGAKLKRKRHSCSMCKPHKTGGADKKKPRDRHEQDLAEVEMDAALHARHARAMGFCPCGNDLYGSATLCYDCQNGS